MGTYTSTFKMYKPASNEVVNVEQQLNYNWRIADINLKALLEYVYTTDTVPVITSALPRYRYYKTYSNSVISWLGSIFWQDTYAGVYPWVSANSILANGWSAHPDYPPYYRIVHGLSMTTTQIEWTGSIWRGGSTITANTDFTGIMTMPGSITPVTAKYFQVNAGNGSGGFSVARLGFFSNGDVQIKRYGVATTGTLENKIDLNGIKYCLEEPA